MCNGPKRRKKNIFRLGFFAAHIFILILILSLTLSLSCFVICWWFFVIILMCALTHQHRCMLLCSEYMRNIKISSEKMKQNAITYSNYRKYLSILCTERGRDMVVPQSLWDQSISKHQPRIQPNGGEPKNCVCLYIFLCTANQLLYLLSSPPPRKKNKEEQKNVYFACNSTIPPSAASICTH